MLPIHTYIHWKTIGLLGLLFSFFAFYLFPTYQAELDQIAGTSVTLLDARTTYNSASVSLLFERIGTEGRLLYTFISGRIDMIYPIIYALFFFSILYKLTLSLSSKWRYLSMLPIIAAFFDYLENFSILSLLHKYPIISDFTVSSSVVSTQIKWLCIILSFVSIIVLSIRKLLRTIF